MSQHPELGGEQAFRDHAYQCLDAMRDRAVYLKSLGYLGGNIHADVGLTPEAEKRWDMDRQRRVDALTDTGAALCFGRIDRRTGERFYVGRRHVEDGDGEPVVTDWRAPSAVPFYRATVVDPMALRQRRRFLIDHRKLADIFDEDFENPSANATVATYVPDPLLAEIERARTGEMRDIVATIQAEQDMIIRAPLEQCIVVQGGPGTGKTAVGLHRAAYLLYSHRDLFERERLLIVGPNKIFFRYISQVLPSLGETAGVQLTVEGLAGVRFPVRSVDEPETARVKGDSRMATVIGNAVMDRVRPPADDVRVTTKYGDVVLAADDIAGLVKNVAAAGRPMTEARSIARGRLVELAWTTYLARRTADLSLWAEFADAVRASQTFKAAVDRMWPTVSAAQVIRQLYGNRPLLKRAAAAILTDDERGRLARKPSRRLADEQWTIA